MGQARKPRVDELDTMMHIRGAREETLADLYQEREMRTPVRRPEGRLHEGLLVSGHRVAT